jgi:hypothetical protein
LADLGLTLCYWAWVEAPQLRARGVPSLTSQPGWYTRDRFVRRYAEGTGRDLSQISYYEVLGIFKLAVILQQIYYRFRRGQTQDTRFENFGDRVKGLVELADSLAGKSTWAPWVVRHGQAGTREAYDSLSELGERQTRLLGEHFISQGIRFASAYAGAVTRQHERICSAVCIKDCFQRNRHVF